MECLHQRLRQGEAGGLDHDVLDAALGKDGIERRHELVGDGAAQAAIGEFDDVFFGTGVIAAAFENLAVDADVAKFVDDHREPPALRVGEHMADQCRLAGAEKAGDDGAGMRASEPVIRQSLKSMGGTRAISPRLSGAGRPRQGKIPSAARAKRRAPSTRASAQVASSPPNT